MTDDPLVSTTTAAIKMLETAGVDYAVTGSVMTSVHGEPVVSQDIDIIVMLDATHASRLAAAIPRRFYCPEGSIQRLAEDGGMTNLIDSDTGLKVDLCVMSEGPYRASVFRRKIRVNLGPDTIEFNGVTPEDIILMKLDWRRESRSEKQWRNALSVAQVKGARLDWKYMFEQARVLNIEDDLIKLRDEAGI